MKIIFNGIEVLELNETKKKVIKYDIPSSIFENDMKRRCEYWIKKPCEKFIHQYQKIIRIRLQEKNIEYIPINLIDLGVKFAEEYPSTHLYEDLSSPLECKVGDQSFSLSLEHQKIWRRLLEFKDERDKLIDQKRLEKDTFEGRLEFILIHKYEKCLERLKLAWLPKLESRGILEIPLDEDKLAELIFSQPDYMDRESRDAEEL